MLPRRAIRPVPRRPAATSRDPQPKRDIPPRAGRPQHRRETCAAPRRCGTDLKVASHSVGAGGSAEPRTISRAALPRTCLPGAPHVCRVRANPQNRPSSRDVRRRDLRPGYGVPHQAKQRGAGSARNHRFKLAAGDPAACDEPPAVPADQNGRRPQKGRRSRQTAGNPAVCVDPQPPRLTTGVAHNALQTFTDQREPPPATTASARSVPAPSARTKQGANRMTGVVTRDSAQHRPIASIGRMRVSFLQHI